MVSSLAKTALKRQSYRPATSGHVSHSLDTRANEIRSWLPKHPSIALVVAAVYFEWIVCRSVIGLSNRLNKELRADMVNYFGLDAYKKLWAAELVHRPGSKSLSHVVRQWSSVRDAFKARNVLVHGRDRYTPKMATPHVEALLGAVQDISSYALELGVDINKRLPQRRAKRQSGK